MNAMQARGMPAKKTMGPDYYIRHYLNLFWRWKWFIVVVTPIVFLGWMFAAVKYGQSRPALESRVVLQFLQNSGSNGPIDNQVAIVEKASSDALIHSRTLLESVAERLSLQVAVKKYYRRDIFDSIAIEKSAPVGRYDFVVKKDGYALYYTNKKKQIYKKIVMDGKLSELSSFSFPFVSLKLTREFIVEPQSMTFYIRSLRETVDDILQRLFISFPGGEEKSSIMIVALKGFDYPLTAQTVNGIADDFVRRSAETKQGKKSGSALILEKQLQSARNDLASAEEALRQFREANPTVGAISALSSSLTEVSSLENSLTSLKRSIDDAVALQSRCSGSVTLDDQITALYEAITFLTTRQSVAAPGLQIDLNEAITEKRRVDADYSPQHPIVIENRKKILRIASNISKALSDIIDKMRSDVASASNKRNVISAENQRLPSKELRYAELERKRATLAELYSNILTRYNINKMSEASQGSDVFIVDRAVTPGSPGRFKVLLPLLIIGMVLALGSGFGVPAAFDYLDKSARVEQDCLRFSTVPFLESIPSKKGDTGKRSRADKEKLDDRLVAASFEPDIFNEMYRSLRTKILLHLHDESHKMLVVTSLNVSEGKSLTASNLSIVMAQQKLRTVLIDGDMRRGVQHHSFVLEKSPGLSEILSSPDDITTLPIHSFFQKTHIPNLSLLACGMPIPNPAECMNSNKFRDLTSVLVEWFDVVVLDTPPLRVAVDAAILPEAFNHYILVARAAKTNIDALEKKINEFPGLRQKVLGIVLNGAPIDTKMHNYAYSYYRH